MVTRSSLQLDISRTFYGISEGRLKVRANKKIRIAARVTGVNVPKGSLLLIWEKTRATLTEGSASNELPTGTYQQDFEWVLQPYAVIGKTTFKIEIEARAGSLIQKSSLSIEIHSKKLD